MPNGARHWGLPLAVALVTAACFLPALGNDFVAWDDDMNFTENAAYRGLSPTHLRWMVTTRLGGHYQPLSWLSLGLDYTLWRMNPAGYHLTNVLLHAANAFLVTLLVIALGTSGVAAAVGGLFFGLHPLRVESVAWATERRDVLSAFFCLLTVLAYLRAVREKSRGWYVAALGTFTLSLLAKASGVTLPAVLVVLDLYPLRRFATPGRRMRVLLEKVPFVVLALAGAAAAVSAARPVLAMRSLAEHGIAARVAQGAYGLCFYLWKTAVPVGLSPLYLLDLRLDPAAPRYVAAMIAVLVITVALVWLRHRWPWALAAWAAYATIVAPVLGLAQTGPQLAADRYTYLACIPWAILVAAAVARAPGPSVYAAASAVLVLLAALTVRQIAVWKDSRTLWEHVLRLDPASYVGYTNRGYVRFIAGDHAGAFEDYAAALRIHPGYALAWYARGTARQSLGDPAGAITDLSNAIRLSPREPRYWNNRGWAREKTGDVQGAAADYAEALRVAGPDFEGRALIEENLAAMRALGARLP